MNDGTWEKTRGEGREERLPVAPSATRMWRRVLIVASAVVALFVLDRLSALLLNKWLLESMGYGEVFRTNFGMQAMLFTVAFALFVAAVAVPAFAAGLGRASRLTAVWIGALGGVLIGYALSLEFYEFLGPIEAVPFGETDPIFGNDISFYVFDLPPIRSALRMALIVSVAALLSSIVTSLSATRGTPRPRGTGPLVHWLGRIGTPATRVSLLFTGALVALMIWLRRYGLLTMPNFEDSTEGTGSGAEYVDIVGFFSTKNSIYVEALAILALAAGLTLLLGKARQALREPGSVDLAKVFGPAAFALVLLPGITTDLLFRSVVAVRDQLFVVPNEPLIQLPYLQRHIDATNAAFGLDSIEESTFVPASADDPLPELQALLDSPTVRNAPLWSGSVSRYSRRVAPQYVQRILLAEGDMTVFSPTLQILEAQETLRPYYGFMDVDTIVEEVDGELAMFAGAARELPQDIVRPWLIAWGQRSFFYTQGHGLITLFASQRTEAGDPVYSASGVPIETRYASLDVDDPAIYYGEGAINVAFSNAIGLDEHGVSTEQGREEAVFPRDLDSGIRVDSLLERLVVGYRSGHFLEVLFSDLIGDGTRAHVFRRPIERLEQLAPFIEADTDPYMVPADGGLRWLVNAVTHSDAYPYSARTFFGNIADLRTEWRPLELMNYVADSVKVVIDARTGHVDLYRFADEPVVETWAAIYPTLFKDKEDMPESVRSHVQYPQELMSIQFNKIYPFYHQRDALTFYNGEDLMDDADEVVGPILGESGAAITFSQGLFYWIAEAEGAMPLAEPPAQFTLSKTYTPQDPLNLRAVANVYQTGESYGRISVLKLPKGHFYPGPEQADAAIDQDAYIAQQIGLWNRLGVEVIRGRTSTLIVGEDILYVEPIFIRSRQNPVPQLQRVIVVFRGKPHMGRTVEEALRYAIEGGRLDTFGNEVTAQLVD